mmetsp:Transcript_82593/g.198212  ORF Transcript_82593/g.198212 Transcript_82593/m.198212 type:complete len:82 (-) Transcript_82593:229-474(-)
MPRHHVPDFGERRLENEIHNSDHRQVSFKDTHCGSGRCDCDCFLASRSFASFAILLPASFRIWKVCSRCRMYMSKLSSSGS